ncbi:amino acid adenylation domain-containing protein [Paenibacillus oleatilyticus]|uniref:Amino acid adenylation domain-containing protein n=1 Tax=Paenibacillus oleatilyticus TaxID=2594886 RepID=A0ABV4VA42_9BACL
MDKILYPLTHPQRRILQMETMNSGTPVCNIGGPVRYKGPIKLDVLEQAIHMFITGNEAVRLQITECDGEFKQYVEAYHGDRLDMFDFSSKSHGREAWEQWVKNEARKPIALTDSNLFYFALFKLPGHEYGYLAKFHHIIADGWSMQLMTDEITSNYQELIGVKSSEHIRRFGSYLDYLEQEQVYRKSQRFEKNRQYWANKLHTLPVHVPVTLSDKVTNQTRAERLSYDLDVQLSLTLRQTADLHGCSLHTLFVTFFCILVYKSTGYSDIIISVPVANRSGINQKRTFGMFTSTMPLRVEIPVKASFISLLAQINEELRKAYYHQKYPYDLLVQDLFAQSHASSHLYELCINCYNTRLQTEMNGIPIYNYQFHNGHQTYSLQLIVRDWSHDGHLTLDFDYKTEEYTDERIRNLYEKLQIVMAQVLESPDILVEELSLFGTGEEEELIFQYNSTKTEYPQERAIHQLFEEQTIRTPFKIALTDRNRSMTYIELNEKANQLSAYLINRGAGPGSIIALYMDHSFLTVIGILAVLKAGATYLPLDVSDPLDRVRYMLQETNCMLLLTDRDAQMELLEFPQLNLEDRSLYMGEKGNPTLRNGIEDVAYVIYTSGSTGEPKGTLIGHRSLVNYIWWARKMYVKDDSEVFALFTSLAFDLTVTSIFTPLISGGRIEIYPTKEGEQAIAQIVGRNQVTVLKLTPSHLSLIQKMRLSNTSIKRFIVGGEDLKSGLARDIQELFGPDIEILNEYGPTEATVGCMLGIYSYEDVQGDRVPIGYPADNVQIYLLDKYLRPVPKFEIGDIHISGEGLSKGYLKRPELNKEKFVANPFLPGQKMYRTGDRGRFLASGEMEYLGRDDELVKQNGYRIELSEIDNALLTCKGVARAVTLQLLNTSGHMYLCSFVVDLYSRTEKELKSELTATLPHYMIPTSIEFVENLPLNRNGKIDRQKLVSLKHDKDAVRVVEKIPPRNEKEAVLVQTISEILKVNGIGVTHSFYRLGGDSIGAIQIVSALQQKGYQIKVKDIMSHPVIEDMAGMLQSKITTGGNYTLGKGAVPITPIVSWFWGQGLKKPEHFNQNILLRIKEHVSDEMVVQAWRNIFWHHDSLRLCWDERAKQLRYTPVGEYSETIFENFDLSNIPTDQQEQEMNSVILHVNESFKLHTGPLAKACLVNHGNGVRYLLLTAHHLVMDGFSWRIILEDLQLALKQLEQGEIPKLPDKSHSYQQWAEMLPNYDGRREAPYWQRMIREYSFSPFSEGSGYLPDIFTDTRVVELEEQETAALLTSANEAYGTQARDLLLTALFLTIFRHWNIQQAIIELEGHGREELFKDIHLNRTVGWFTSLYPFGWALNGQDLSSQIKSMKEQIRQIPNNGAGYGILKYIKNEITHETAIPIRFNYLGEFPDTDYRQHWSIVGISGFSESSDALNGISSHNHLSCHLELKCIVIHQKLKISASYNRALMRNDDLINFIHTFKNQIRHIVEYCCSRDEMEYTVSDFDAAHLTEEDLNTLLG